MAENNQIQNLKVENGDKGKEVIETGLVENLDLLLEMEMLQEDPDLEMFGNLKDFQSEIK